MKKNLFKILSGVIILAMILFEIHPLEGIFSGMFSDNQVLAADGEEATYSFLVSDAGIENGGIINYSKYNNEDKTLWITLRSSEGLAPGTTLSWAISNENIISVNQQDDENCRVQLHIISPGYSGLSVTVKMPDGTLYTAAAYCSIYVPLEWSDNISATDPTLNNIKAGESPKGSHYGLFLAQTGDKEFTLQMYTRESANYPDCFHYLRKLKYVDYTYKSGSGHTGNVTSDVDKEDLGAFRAALTWETSDPNVVEVDTLTGMITAVGAGFARVTVKTNTINEMLKKGDSLSFNVLVVPEGYVSGYTTEYKDRFLVTADPLDDDIIIQTNAKYANNLSWKVYSGDTVTPSRDITDKIEDKIDISQATGRAVISGLPAGVYHIAAISRMDEEALKSKPTYNITQTLIEYFRATVIVPLDIPKGPVVMNYYNKNVYDSYDLLGVSNLPEGLFRFSSGNSAVAAVGLNDGLIEAKGLGKCKIIMNKVSSKKLEEIFGVYVASPSAIRYDGNPVDIDVTVINGVTLSSTNETLPLGASHQLVLTSPSPYEGTISWSSNDTNIVTVDDAGIVKAVGVGEAIITVKIKVNGVTKRARCNIKVTPSVNEITLSSKQDYVEVGDNLVISAAVSPAVTDTKLIWTSSDPSVAEITDAAALAATITGKKSGTTVITAVNRENSIVGSKIIKVVEAIKGLTLSDTEVTIPQTARFYQLYATCIPALPDSQKLRWNTSNAKIATVDANGKVSLIKPGTAVISVITENGLSASCTFTITQGVTGIKLDETNVELYVGENRRLTYIVTPSNASQMTLKWISSDSKIASVDATGYISAKNVGKCVVMAQSTDGTGVTVMCNVTVLRNAKSISLDASSVTLNVGDMYELEASLTPADSSDTITFESSNTKVATVSKKGKISAKAKGSCVIIAKTNMGLMAYCSVEVNQQVAGISLDVEAATIYVGDEIELTATIEPKNATDKEVEWTSSDESVASVDDDGVVKGLQGGVSLIKCVTVDGDYMAYCMITVIEEVATITVEETVEIGIGERLRLNAVVSNSRATNKKLKWSSSNKKVCKVNAKGVITGVKEGKANITVRATDGSGADAVCEVTVINPIETIEVNPTYVTLIQGSTQKLNVSWNPGNATYEPVWSSDNEKVALVNKKGLVTAVTPGDAIITVAAQENPEIKAVAYVHVIAPVYATSVTFAESEIIMTSGESKTVPFSIVPQNFTESYTWSSDNPIVASVDENTGRITAKAVGSATITLMTRSGRKGSVRVYVVGLSRDYVELHQYESTLINLEIDGTGSNNLTLRWDTDNQTIAEIANGKITGKALGKTLVYAVVNGRKLPCVVKVIKNR